MSRLVTILIMLCVAAGVVAASIGEHWRGVALLITGASGFGFRRRFYFVSALEECGIPVQFRIIRITRMILAVTAAEVAIATECAYNKPLLRSGRAAR